MQEQIEQRFMERKLLDHEVDTTSIDQLFEIYNGLGGLGADSMQTEIINDFHQLEEIVGPLNYDHMEMVKMWNPNVFCLILSKVFNYLGYLARIPITDENGNPKTMNLYRVALENLIEKNTGPNGEKPGWLTMVEYVFHWGVKNAKLLDQIGQGKIPDMDMFVDYLTNNMMDVT